MLHIKAELFRALFFVVLIAKVALYISLKNKLHNLGYTGGDADYYDLYANGEEFDPSSTWPILLRWLNELGLYSRELLSFIIFSTTCLFIPYLVYLLSNNGINGV